MLSSTVVSLRVTERNHLCPFRAPSLFPLASQVKTFQELGVKLFVLVVTLAKKHNGH